MLNYQRVSEDRIAPILYQLYLYAFIMIFQTQWPEVCGKSTNFRHRQGPKKCETLWLFQVANWKFTMEIIGKSNHSWNSMVYSCHSYVR